MRPILFCLSLLLAVAAPASSAADSARARMEAFSRDLKSVSADFSQTVRTAQATVGDTSRGTLALQAPRQFRWQTLEPYEQLIVADGTRVWIYDPDLEQVSVRSQSTEEAQSPLTVLTDLSLIDRDFVASEAGEHDGLVWLRLTARAEEPEFEYAELGFDAGGLARMTFKDQLGNVTEMRFSAWKRNPGLPADTFRFTPPEGVDVIGDAAGPQVFPVRP